MIRDIGRSIGNAVMETVGRASSQVQERRPLPVDLLESDDAYLAVFDAPGTTSSDVQVRFSDNTLEVRVDRFRDFHDGFEMRVPGRGLSLDGKVRLPRDARVNPDDATATLRENGTLTVEVPKDSSHADVSVTDESATEAVEAGAASPDAEQSDDDS